MPANSSKYFFELLTKMQNPKSDRVFFNSFSGQYNDNPKYISILLHKKYPNVKQYWYISEKSTMNDIPEYIEVLRKKDFNFYRKKNSCRFIVENSAGFYLFYSPKKSLLKRVLINKKQFDIATWHGYPFKNIGAMMFENKDWKEECLYTSANVLLSGSKALTCIFKKSFLGKMPILECGSPRNDILFDDSCDLVKNLKLKLKLPLDKRILLYAPTYRYSPEDSGITQIKNIDLPRLLDSLSGRFGGDWVFVFRAHNMVLLSLKNKHENIFSERLLSGNEYDDMAEYLKVCDALLTDYSGCIYDVMLTDKPCFLYAHDREHYCNVERGLQVDILDLPYTFNDDFDSLIANIANYDDEIVSSKKAKYLRTIGCIEDGKACERIVDTIASLGGYHV